MLLKGLPVFLKDQWDSTSFVTAYLGIALSLAFYLGHRFTKGKGEPWMQSPEDMDLITGLAELVAQEMPPIMSINWYHFYWKLCE